MRFADRGDEDIGPLQFFLNVHGLAVADRVTVASALVSSAAIGRPTSMLRPRPTAREPATGDGVFGKEGHDPRGSAGGELRPPGKEEAQVLRMVTRPRLCPGGSRRSPVRCPPVPGAGAGRGSRRYPRPGSASAPSSTTVRVVAFSGSSIPTDPMPTCSQALCFIRTYIWEAGSFPAMTVARWGERPASSIFSLRIESFLPQSFCRRGSWPSGIPPCAAIIPDIAGICPPVP